MTELNRFFNARTAVCEIAYARFRSVHEFDMALINGEDISEGVEARRNALNEYRNLGRSLIAAGENLNWQDIENDANRAEEILNAYEKLNETVQKILTAIEPGEPAESAVRKLAELSGKAEYINTGNFKAYMFFEEYSENDIRRQIEEFNGTVKLNGFFDAYVHFENGKASEVYF